MPKQAIRIYDLNQLQQSLHGCATSEEALDVCLQFIETVVPQAKGQFTQTAVSMGAAAETHQLFPVAHTAWHLILETGSPLTPDEQSSVEIALAILAATPNVSLKSDGGLSRSHVRMLQQISQLVADHRRFPAIARAVVTEFQAIYPAATLTLHLLEEEAFNSELLGPLHAEETPLAVNQADPAWSLLMEGQVQSRLDESGGAVWIPLYYASKIRAILQVVRPDQSSISANYLFTLEQLRSYLNISLGNQYLSDRAWQRANQLETIYRITESARVLRPLEPTLVQIHRQLLQAYQAPTCYIALFEQTEQQISFPCVWDNGNPVSWETIPINNQQSLVAWVVRNNLPFATDDWVTEAPPVPGIVAPDDVSSVICVPMRLGDEVLGAISIQHHHVAAFNASDYQTLMAVAAHAAVIIKNAQLYSSARQLVDKGARDYQTAVSLRQAIASISTSLQQSEVAQQLLLALGNVINYANAWVFLYHDERFQLIAWRNFYERPLAVNPTDIEAIWTNHPYIQRVIETQETLCLTDLKNKPECPQNEHTQSVKTWLAAPLLAGSKMIGIMLVDSEKPNAFDTHEEWLVSSLAAHAGVALQNAQLFQQTQQQLKELATLHQATATMTANLDQRQVFQTVISEMVNALKVDSCTIFVRDMNMQRLEQTAHRNKNIISGRAETHTNSKGLSLVNNLEQHALVRQVLDRKEIKIIRTSDSLSAEHQHLLKVAGLQSLMLVPLVRHETTVGLLAMGQEGYPRSYTDQQIRLAQNLAGQAAVAIEHSRLFGQAQRRVDELSAFHQIVLKLNSPLQLNVVLDTITESALNLIDATNLHIFLYDQATRKFTMGSALWRDGRRHAAVMQLRPSGQGLTSTVVQSGEAIVINDAPNHPFYQSKESQKWGIQAIAGFPLKYGEDVLGAFTATYLHPHVFSEDELLLLTLLAEQAAVAVRNASLYANSQRRLLDMSALVDMAKQVTGNLKLQNVLQTTVQILRNLLNARASTITMLSDDKEELIVKAADGVNPEFGNARMRLEGSISGEVFRTSRPVYIQDTHSDPNFVFFDETVNSLLVVPLIIRDAPIGTLTVDSADPYAFSESDVQLMMIAGAQVSVAIANARLFEELESRATELKEAYEELKENDRLKDELVQNVSHELRTPLTFVKGYVDLLIDGEMGLVTDEQLSALQIISDKTTDITRIISDIITLQKINSGNLKLETVSMKSLIELAVAGSRFVAERKNVDIVPVLPEAPGLVMIDKGRINQVLDNLIGNALKFSPDGGVIQVLMEEREDDVLVVVKDQGIGIPQEKHKKIFERFYQVDGSARRRFGGTGIGLAIVKRIIDAHNGTIWLESEVEKGSAFYFSLPKADRSETNALEP